MGNNKSTPIGIDLGTEYCCVGAFINGNVEIIKNRRDNATTPSYVALTKDGNWLVGEEAKEQAVDNPSNTVFDVKRLIGRRFDDPKVESDRKNYWPYTVVDHEGTPKIELIKNGEKKLFSPEEIASHLFRYMKDIAELHVGHPVIQVVITVPIYFNETQRQMTINAARMVGLDVIQTINEPIASALAYCYKRYKRLSKHYVRYDYIYSVIENKHSLPENFLVLDLGAGTLDLIIAKVFWNTSFRIIKSNGDTHLGGNDFNQRMVYYSLNEIKKERGLDFSNDMGALHLLNIECENAKVELSEKPSAVINFNYKNVEEKIEISRDLFEEINKDLFERIISVVTSTLNNDDDNDNNSLYKNIEGVFLIGGSSKMPKIKELLNNILPNTDFDDYLCKIISCKEAVAYGATLKAAFLSNYTIESYTIETKIMGRYGGTSRENTYLPKWSNFASMSYGIVDDCGKLHKFIDKNDELPKTVTKIFKNGLKFINSIDGNIAVILRVYQGEAKRAKENHFLGNIQLNDLRLPLNLEVALTVDDENVKLRWRDRSRSILWWLQSHKEIILTNSNEFLDEILMKEIRNENFFNAFLDDERFSRHFNKKLLKYRIIWDKFKEYLDDPISIDEEELTKLDDENLKENDIVTIKFTFPFGASETDNIVTQVQVLKIFDSNAKPKLLNCLPMNKKLIYKNGDNLYDEQIVMAFLNVFNEIWKFSKTKFKWERDCFINEEFISNKCYRIVPVRNPRFKAGFIEFIESAEPAEDLRDRNLFFRSRRQQQHKFNDLANSLRPGGEDFVRICASSIATFVSMYVLAIGDRHQGNMMLANDHSFFNIDFGYSFGESVFLIDTWDFPIPFFLKNYLNTNDAFKSFIDECWNALQILTDYQPLFEILASKYMKDKKKLNDAKKAFKDNLNTIFVTFSTKMTFGSYAALPKNIVHKLNK